ncbi:3-ketosteroid 9alpha-monooxygenase subunit A [Oryzisolibacter propanilivorax]|uniref:3-ketosteroid 9alpha-monooxygenase subunit A n=1 Tax=Oryzisolibacter propanilivorax TaxID=1527607 RepID=A0A1G9NWV4_9BURK|nr:Rieske 2Fe-2S domain-containing protein [Oryzisolibacter propanilivorax]SDL90834.1 3-ketosteroid 9alpha-monooxygenase subunit A [Oryzisolibacter propanilivorax]
MATTKEYRLGEFTFPRGWFMISDSEALNTHKPVAVRFFGQDFALYRGRESGKVVLLDAYCPHMKTHLAARNTTSYVVLDGGGSNVEGDGIRCPYHGWRFGADGKCNHIPYHDGPIPAAAAVKSWRVEERYGAVWVWYDPEGGEPDYPLPQFDYWDDESVVNGVWDQVGELAQHPQEVVDNICDYGHLSPIHGSTVEHYENEFKGHHAIQRQSGGHRTLVGEGGASDKLQTITSYHGPGILVSQLSGMFDSFMMIMHTPIDDGKVRVWHNLLVRTAHGGKPTAADLVSARQFQQASMAAFAQDFEVWNQKAACLNPLFIPSDGPFMKARVWYKQFYNPRAKAQEFLEQCEGIYVPKGIAPFTPQQRAEAVPA